ncbi:Sulfotransferase 1 family member D1 [Armadillidium vulgare]|nr:Sulfotransferase 1 family member D1 [Armadillidium vulgare]
MALKSGHRIVPLVFEEAVRQYEQFHGLDFLIYSSPVDPTVPGTFLHDTFAQAHPNRNPKDGIFLQLAELTEDPRIIKTHLPFSLLSPSLLETCKVIYVARDPKDVAVSYCHHSRLFKIHVVSGPFWPHLKEGWNRRKHPNIHYCFYEDMKANPKDEILRIQKFLDLDLTESQLNNIVHYTSFPEMSKREQHNLMGSDTGSMWNEEVFKKDGGFYRKVLSQAML